MAYSESLAITTGNSGSKGLIGPATDSFFVFGLSGIVFILFLLFGESLKEGDWWYTSWLLAFLINSPHFLISYLLFYRLHKGLLFKQLPFFSVGIAVPLVLLSLFLVLGFSQRTDLLVVPLFVMFFLVGWHYIKQCFGCFIILNGMNGVKLSLVEQSFLKYSLFLLWFCSFFALFSNLEVESQFWNYDYVVPAIPRPVLSIAEFLGYLSLGLVSGWLLYRRASGVKDTFSAVLALISAYVWLLPLFRLPGFALFIPLFHSLQYMLFSHVLVVNEEKARDAGSGYLKPVVLFWWGPAFILGALCFHFVPDILDKSFSEISEAFGGLFFLIAFVLFINIHHYLIDSVMWKGKNTIVRERLRPIS
ncbi:hypothetical protein [Microbulbifer sp. TYP-18]|uniref:hypothetical protein n=1 Tax=Microbulbifer sp. TYP-18 TaxID=3230024 RepID=UPI0034C5CE3B